jgi:hypothetical protein
MRQNSERPLSLPSYYIQGAITIQLFTPPLDHCPLRPLRLYLVDFPRTAARAHSMPRCTASPRGLTPRGPAQFLNSRGPRAHISCSLARFPLIRFSLYSCLSVLVRHPRLPSVR